MKQSDIDALKKVAPDAPNSTAAPDASASRFATICQDLEDMPDKCSGKKKETVIYQANMISTAACEEPATDSPTLSWRNAEVLNNAFWNELVYLAKC